MKFEAILEREKEIFLCHRSPTSFLQVWPFLIEIEHRKNATSCKYVYRQSTQLADINMARCEHGEIQIFLLE